MNRILFVSEEHEAAPLRDALRKHVGQWQMSFVSSSAEAIAALAAGPWDVVVADVIASQLDGLALLARVRDERPETARIVLSPPAAPDVLMRALPVAHQFVAMPCEAVQLWKLIERTCCLNGLVGNAAIRRLLGGLERLPSVPRSYVALTQAMAREEQVSLGEIVAIVEKDTAMAAKLVQLVNSAFFGRSRRISSIPVALSFLGLERLRALALGTHVFGMLTEAQTRACGLERLQERSMLTAQLARCFLSATGRAEEGFTAGLLQNVGKLVLAVCLQDRYQDVVDEARRRRVPVQAMEREHFDVSHAEVGACLLSHWGLPVTIVEAVAFHHEPGSVLHDETALVDAVHVADALVEQVLERSEPESRELVLDPVVMSREGMEERVRAWRAKATEAFPAGMPA